MIPISASKGRGIQELKDLINEVGEKRPVSQTRVAYDEILEKAADTVAEAVDSIARHRDVDPDGLPCGSLRTTSTPLSSAAAPFRGNCSVNRSPGWNGMWATKWT